MKKRTDQALPFPGSRATSGLDPPQLLAVPCIQMAGESNIEKIFMLLNYKIPGTYALKIHTWNRN